MIGDTGEFSRAWEVAAGIEGWLTEAQARKLFELARLVEPPRCIVEIGSHRGKSTVILLAAKHPDSALVAVDPFDDPRWGGGSSAYESFVGTLETIPHGGEVEVLRAASADAAESWDGRPVGLLYIDGAHDRPSVVGDIEEWGGHVAEGGHMCIHDAFSSVGVTAAVAQTLFASTSFRYLGSVRTLAIFARRDLSRLERARSSAALVARLGYFARNVCVKLALRRRNRQLLALLRHKDDGDPY
ncbi:MAG: class I SAM-dependent methyltransferase [Actinobacteria bacterium]|nr:class I SAM-dependent methyltransferase [Actinomycetota bacterium]